MAWTVGVKDITGNIMSVTIDNPQEATVLDLKAKIREKDCSLPPYIQRLVHNTPEGITTQLEDSCKLASYSCLQDGATLYLLVQLKGKMAWTISIKDITGNIMSVTIDNPQESTVLDLKARIQAKDHSLPTYLQRLVHKTPGGTIMLKDGCKLASYSCLQDGATLFLVQLKPCELYVRDPQDKLHTLIIPSSEPESYSIAQLRVLFEDKAGQSPGEYKFWFKDHVVEETRHGRQFTLKDCSIETGDQLSVVITKPQPQPCSQLKPLACFQPPAKIPSSYTPRSYTPRSYTPRSYTPPSYPPLPSTPLLSSPSQLQHQPYPRTYPQNSERDCCSCLDPDDDDVSPFCCPSSYFVWHLVIAVPVFCSFVVSVILGVITVLEVYVYGTINTTQINGEDCSTLLISFYVPVSVFGLCYGIFWIPCLCCMSCDYDGCQRFHSRRVRGMCSICLSVVMCFIVLFVVEYMLNLHTDDIRCSNPVITGAIITSAVMSAFFSIQLVLCGCEILYTLYLLVVLILKIIISCLCSSCDR